MHLDCTGSGAPTIVLEAGLGNDSLVWGGIQPALSTFTRVCSYDRAGFGWSDAAPAPRDADHIAAELHQLLREARIEGPIVLMGHSIAGIYIRDYAAHYPEQVAGLVFVDGSTPLQDRNPALKAADSKGLPPWASGLMQRAVSVAGLPRMAGACAHMAPGFDPHAAALLAEDLCHPQFSALQQELKSFDASGRQTIHSGPFGALPVLIFSQDPAQILSAPNSNPQSRDFAAAWNGMQEDLKNLSTRSRRIIAKGSSHYVLIDRADLIKREVPLFIAQLRGLAPERSDYGITVME
jgi:pimeloyl-ACP methyl ester carboxylesterase